MATLAKYIYDLRGLLRNHRAVDDDYLTDRQLEFWIISQRSLWIVRKDRLFTQTNHTIQQTLVEEVISIDRSFELLKVPAEYRILRTNRQLPKLINFESWDGIISTGSIDMVKPRWNHCEYQEAINSGNGRFNKHQIYTFTHNQYLYLLSKSVTNYWPFISQIAVVGIFEDPREVAQFSHASGEPCWTIDDEYPISLDLWDYLKGEIVKTNIDALVKIPVDISNDNNSQKLDMP